MSMQYAYTTALYHVKYASIQIVSILILPLNTAYQQNINRH